MSLTRGTVTAVYSPSGLWRRAALDVARRAISSPGDLVFNKRAGALVKVEGGVLTHAGQHTQLLELPKNSKRQS